MSLSATNSDSLFTGSYKMRAAKLVFNEAKVALITQGQKIAPAISPPFLSLLHSAILRPMQSSHHTLSNVHDPNELEAIFQKKRALRSKIRKALKNMTPIQRSQEDEAIQRIILEAPWFKSCKSLCTYISAAALREVDTSTILSEVLRCQFEDDHESMKKKVYVPLVEDKFSNMRMLKISSLEDLSLSSMDILEPNLVDANGNEHEDVMQACDPVDIFILPAKETVLWNNNRSGLVSGLIISCPFYVFVCMLLGLAFDRSGRRLGRSGGYYDTFLKKYEEHLKEKNWKQPLLVALAYSVQIVDEGAIAVTPNDVPVDALVCPDGYIPVRSATGAEPE